jgi:lipopolysaccharide/colanic/teichoic acid biosynthesis glycosyltransferase
MLGLEFTTNLLRWRNRVIKRPPGLIFGMILYDTYYIRNWSLWLDPWILFRTVRAVLPGKGVR